MATYTIYRSVEGTIDCAELKQRLQAFHILYSGPFRRGHEKVDIMVRGQWPDAFNGDGLYLTYNTGVGRIVHIGTKLVTIEFTDHQHKTEQVKLELTTSPTDGYIEIQFITMPKEG